MLESLAIIESAVSSRHGLLMKKSKTATSSTRSDLRASCQSNDVTVWLTYTGRTAFSITNPRRKFKHNTNQSKTNSFFALELSHSNHHDAHVDTIQTPSSSCDCSTFRVYKRASCIPNPIISDRYKYCITTSTSSKEFQHH